MTLRKNLTAAVAAAAIVGAVLATPGEGEREALATESSSASMTLNNKDRQSVINAYQKWYLPLQNKDFLWNGDWKTCDPGTSPQWLLDDSLSVTNYFRAQAGSKPVSINAVASDKAQKASLWMKANGKMTHYADPGTACYSEEARDGAANSNISLFMLTETPVIWAKGFMGEEGLPNVRHRELMMEPGLREVGFGQTNSYQAMYLVDASMDKNAATYPKLGVSWPNAGYFPEEFLVGDTTNWSIHSYDYHGVDFGKANATVEPLTAGVGPVTTRRIDNSSNELVFKPENITLPANFGNKDIQYKVTITGVRDAYNGKAPMQDIVYSVTLVNAEGDPNEQPPTESQTPKNLSKPYISGSAIEGETLTAHEGSWDQEVQVTAYEWLLNGTPIAGERAKQYTVTKEAANKSLTLRVTVQNKAGKTASAVSGPVDTVGRPVTPGTQQEVKISGKPAVGNVLSINNLVWDEPMAVTYAWKADGRSIRGAKSSTYKVTKSVRGQKVTVVVTAKSSAGEKQVIKSSNYKKIR